MNLFKRKKRKRITCDGKKRSRKNLVVALFSAKTRSHAKPQREVLKQIFQKLFSQKKDFYQPGFTIHFLVFLIRYAIKKKKLRNKGVKKEQEA